VSGLEVFQSLFSNASHSGTLCVEWPVSLVNRPLPISGGCFKVGHLSTVGNTRIDQGARQVRLEGHMGSLRAVCTASRSPSRRCAKPTSAVFVAASSHAGITVRSRVRQSIVDVYTDYLDRRLREAAAALPDSGMSCGSRASAGRSTAFGTGSAGAIRTPQPWDNVVACQ
jgi:hypothetical protein